MSDTPHVTEDCLDALAEQLTAHGERYTIAVASGSTLLAEGYRSVLARVLAHFGVDHGRLGS